MITVAVAGVALVISDSLVMTINGYDGFQVVAWLSNGTELKEQFDKTGSPDILLLDTNMARINAVETIFWMRAEHPSTKIILFANLSSKLLKPSLIRIGVHSVMTNDMPLSELEKMLLDIKHGLDHAPVASLPPEAEAVYRDQETLSRREFEFINRCCSLDTLGQISVKMNLRLSIVKKISKRVYAKTSVRGRTELIVYAMQNGLTIYEEPIDI